MTSTERNAQPLIINSDIQVQTVDTTFHYSQFSQQNIQSGVLLKDFCSPEVFPKSCLEQLLVSAYFFTKERHSRHYHMNFTNSKKMQAWRLNFVGMQFTEKKLHYITFPRSFLKIRSFKSTFPVWGSFSSGVATCRLWE